MSDVNALVSAALKDFMADSSISQAQVARALGRNEAYVSRRLNGKEDLSLSLDIVGAVASLLHLSPAAVMAELTARMSRPAAPPVEEWRRAFARVLQDAIGERASARVKGVRPEVVRAAVDGSAGVTNAELRRIGVGLGVPLAVVDQYVPGGPGETEGAFDTSRASESDLG